MKHTICCLIFLVVGLQAQAGNKLMWQRYTNDTTRNQNSIYWNLLDQTLDEFGNIYISEKAHSGDSAVPIILKISASGQFLWKRNLLPLNDSGQYYCIDRTGKLYRDIDGNLVNLYVYRDYTLGSAGVNVLLMSKISQAGQIILTQKYNLGNYPNSLVELKDVAIQTNGDFYVALSNEARKSSGSVLTTLQFDKNFTYVYQHAFYDTVSALGYSGAFSIKIRDSLLYYVFGDSGTQFHVHCINMLPDSVLWENQFDPVNASNYPIQLEIMGGYIYLVGRRLFKLSQNDGSLLAQSTEDYDPYRCLFDSTRNMIYAMNVFSKNLTAYDPGDLHFVRNRKLSYIISDIKMFGDQLFVYGIERQKPNINDFRFYKFYKLDTLLNDIDSVYFEAPSYVKSTDWGAGLRIDSELNLIVINQVESHSLNGYISNPLLVQKLCFTCFGDIRGRVFVDMNQNCQFDTSDYIVANNAVKLLPENSLTYTDTNGFYDFFSSPVSSEVECIPFLNGMPFCATGSTYFITPGISPLDTLDFGYYGGKLVNIDLESRLMASTARPGFNQFLLGVYTNHGTEPLYSTQLSVTLDSPFSYVSSYPPMDSIVGQTVFFTLDTILINDSKEIGIQVLSNPNMMTLGDTFRHHTEIFLNGDMMPVNNLDTAWGIVVGSYDPNYIAVTPVGITQNHLIENGTTLDYYVEFQNTGTDTAFNVKINIPIDDDLDFSTFRFTSSSHNCRAQIENNSILFVLENIFLVDSSKDYDKSIGHLTYSIKPKHCKDGTYLTANAAIYFDYNEPVITNTVFNRIGRPGSIFIPDNVDDFNLFPNPSVTNSFKLVVNAISPNYEILVLDLVGRKIPIQDEKYSYNDKDYHAINVLDAAEGFYFVQMRTPHQVISKKWLYLGD